MGRGAMKRGKGVAFKGDGMAGGRRDKGWTSEAKEKGRNPWGGQRHNPMQNMKFELWPFLKLFPIECKG